MAYADQKMSNNRIIALIIVAIIHVAVGYMLVTGLAISAVKNVVERVTTIDIEEPPPPEEEPPPPPPPEEVPPPPVFVPDVPLDLNPNPNPPQTDNTPPPPRPAPDPNAGREPAPAPPPPPPQPDLSEPASPRNQGRWAAQIQRNYPTRAIRREEEGTVGVAVTVNSNGRVDSCSVTRPSGSSALDDAACKGMQRYARFNPAKDRAGNPTSGRFSTSIRYQLD